MTDYLNAKKNVVDVWSVGCILAELLGGRPFFKGRDYVDQLNQILHYLGTPSEETLSRIGSPRAQDYVRNLPYMHKVSYHLLFPHANPEALNLLDRLLAFDPSSRITVEDALEHPYLQIWHDASDEPVCPSTFDFSFEIVEDVAEMRRMILDEVLQFRAEVRQGAAQAQAQAQAQALAYAQQQMIQNGVPIPDAQAATASMWKQEEPRPQEAAEEGGVPNELEAALQRGMDFKA